MSDRAGRKHCQPWPPLRLALAVAIALSPCARPGLARAPRFDGFNVIEAPGHPFGSGSATLALTKLKRLGAGAVAIVPFLWQPSPTSPGIVRGTDMSDDELRAAIRDAHAHGLAVLVKPHVWVPNSWAGTVVMASEQDWEEWFANYQRELSRIAQIAEAEKAEALVIGTELSQTSPRPEWNDVIIRTRSVFSGRLLYVAHNVEDAGTVPFWGRLDAIGVSLYPPLGVDSDRDYRRRTMDAIADRLDALAARMGKPVIVAEIGLRSAEGAAAKPWESAEERVAAPDPTLQADVLSDWLAALHRPAISGVLIWRWLSDPDAGGLSDTDFTVQGKPAEHVLMCAWTQSC
jgi:sugar phosphate isomerase/epimerase